MYLPTDLRQFVGEQMALGNYETFDDLVADALTAFRDKQQAELLEQIDLGRKQIENGECTVLSTEAEVQEFFEKIIKGRSRDRSELVT